MPLLVSVAARSGVSVADAARVLFGAATGDPWTGPPRPPPSEERARHADHLRREREEIAEAEARAAEEAQKGPKGKKIRIPDATAPDSTTILPYANYDAILVGFSGGKDSLACVLRVLEEIGDDAETRAKVELWHHAVDGRPGTEPVFDWPCTESYCRAVARVLDLPIYFSWREGGILRDMERVLERRQGVTFESPSGEIHVPTRAGEYVTRRLLDADGNRIGAPAWPRQSARDLNARWCSSTVKIDVARSAIRNDPRFKQATVLLVTGERRQESNNRSLYARATEQECTTQSRRVDQYRILLECTVEETWGIVQRWGIVPHPCYWLGFGRASCETCIFSGRDEWATILAVHPEKYDRFVGLEEWALATIDADRSIAERVRGGYVETQGRGKNKREIVVPPAVSFAPPGLAGAYWREQATGEYTAPVRVDPARWALPAGGLRVGSGPA